jgi:hypothetical protein
MVSEEGGLRGDTDPSSEPARHVGGGVSSLAGQSFELRVGDLLFPATETGPVRWRVVVGGVLWEVGQGGLVDQEVRMGGKGSDVRAIAGVSHDDDLARGDGIVEHILRPNHGTIREGECLPRAEQLDDVVHSLLDAVDLLQRLAVALHDVFQGRELQIAVPKLQILHHVAHTGDGVTDRSSSDLEIVVSLCALIHETIAAERKGREGGGRRKSQGCAGQGRVPSVWVWVDVGGARTLTATIPLQ